MPTRELRVVIVGDESSFNRSMQRAGAQADGFGGKVKGLTHSLIGVAGLAFGIGGAVTVVKSFVDASIKADAATAKLDQAVVNMKGNVKLLTPVIDAAEASGRRFGFTNTDTSNSLAKLVTAFGATKQAFGELTVAQNYARFSGRDLASSTQMIIQLQEGSAKAAKALGIVLPDLTAKEWKAKAAVDGLTVAQEKGKTMYQELTDKVKGQNAAFAATPAGKIAAFHAQVQNLQEAIGKLLIPAITNVLKKITDWIDKSKNQKKVLEDVHKVIQDVTKVMKILAPIVETAATDANAVAKAVGGWGNALKIVLGLKMISILGGWAGPIAKLIGSAGAGTGIEGAAAKTGLLASRLAALKTMGEIGIIIAVSIVATKGAQQFGRWLGGQSWAKGWAGDSWLPPGVSFDQAAHAMQAVQSGSATAEQIAITRAILGHNGTPMPGTSGTASTGMQGTGSGPKGSGSGGALVQQANRFGVGSGAIYGKTKLGSVGNAVGGNRVFDCSGYTQKVYTTAGYKGFPGTSETQWSQGNGVNWTSSGVSSSDAKPGDLVFMVGAGGASPGHVGIVVSGSGSNATVMQYYSTGQPADTIQLNQIGDLVGIKRYFLVGKKDGATGANPYGPAAPPANDPKAVAAAAAKGAKKPPLISIALQQQYADALGVHDTSKRNTLLTALADAIKADEVGASPKAKLALTKFYNTVESRILAGGKQIASALKHAQNVVKAAQKASIAEAKQDVAEANTAWTKAVLDPMKIKFTHDKTTGAIHGEAYEANLLKELAAHVQAAEKHVGITKDELTKLENLHLKIEDKITSDNHKALNARLKAEAKAQADLLKQWGTYATAQAAIAQTAADNAAAALQTEEGKLTTALGKMQTAADAQFQAQTQSMVDALGQQFFQNGLQTPAEAQLAAMQAADTASGLADALQQAQDQLTADSVSGSRATVLADQQAVQAAQRAIDEGNLALTATAERTAADKSYAAAVAQLQSDRQTTEDAMNQGFQDMTDNINNGVIPGLGDLATLLAKFGINIDTSGFNPSAAKGAQTTSTQAQLSANLAGQVAAFETPDPSIGWKGMSPGAVGRALGLPGFAQGGIGTLGKTQLMIAGENGPEDFMFVPKSKGGIQVTKGNNSGGNQIIINFNAPVFGDKQKVADELADSIHRSLIRKQRRQGSLGFQGTPGFATV